MKTNPKEKLLGDILRDASDVFRQEVFEASLKELRLRPVETKRWPGLPLAIAAAFVIGVGLIYFRIAYRPTLEDRAQIPGSSQTASVSAYPPMETATYRGPKITIVESRQYPASIVQNSSIQQPVEILGDTELLALFPDRPTGLIANAQGTVQLVFLDSQDRMFSQ